MPISDEMRRLSARWASGQGWPKRLEWIEVDGVRGWVGQRFTFKFPIMAITGENGVGKSTLLQGAAAVYQQPGTRKSRSWFASDFFPDTAWEKVTEATVRYSVRQGGQTVASSLRKPGERWRGNPKRPRRDVEYVDLSRIQPVAARVGYSRLAKPIYFEKSSATFEDKRLARLSQVMGRKYDLAKMSLTDADNKRAVPVVSHLGATYSGFHQGAGETTVAELLQGNFPNYAIVLLDEIETSLHPRAQRRLMRELATQCREKELQIVISTHSPYVLDELPPEARSYVMLLQNGKREIIYGVSPEFAMTRMDDVPQHECDLYVEDKRAETLLSEIMIRHSPSDLERCQIIPYGAASVGVALGQMVANKRFPRPSCVFLDGDQGPKPAEGCVLLPGDDAPERVVFADLAQQTWLRCPDRVGRPFAAFEEACARATTISDHHDWIGEVASRLRVTGSQLWQTMCSEWVDHCLDPAEAKRICDAVSASLPNAVSMVMPEAPEPEQVELAPPEPEPEPDEKQPGQGTLFK